MQCFIQDLAKIGNSDRFTVTIGGKTVHAACTGLRLKSEEGAKAKAVIETIKKHFPFVKFADLEFVEVEHGIV